MKRYGQTDVCPLSEPIQIGHHARGRQRHLALGQPIGQIVTHQAHGRYDVIEVEQRLSHAHHDDIGHDTAFAGLPGIVGVNGQPHLTDDLGRSQIALEALLSCGTKGAVEAAPHLGRHAQRRAVTLRDQHRLDQTAAVDRDGPLSGAILGVVLLGDVRRRDLSNLSQLGAE